MNAHQVIKLTVDVSDNCHVSIDSYNVLLVRQKLMSLLQECDKARLGKFSTSFEPVQYYICVAYAVVKGAANRKRLVRARLYLFICHLPVVQRVWQEVRCN